MDVHFGLGLLMVCVARRLSVDMLEVPCSTAGDCLCAQAFADIYPIYKEKKVSLRTAAFMLALDRVSQAHSLRGYD